MDQDDVRACHGKPQQAMILAAGVGSRLDPLTSEIPKPLCPILGKPVMEHIVTLCKEHGFTNLSANTHVMHEKIENYFNSSKEKLGVNFNFVYEKKLTGIAGGVRSCKKYLTDDVILVIMGDALTDIDLTYLYERHIEGKCPVTIAIKEVSDTSQFGVVVTDKNDRVISFQEKPKPEEAKSNLANTAIYFFNQSVLAEIPSELEAPKVDIATDLFQKLMKKNIPLQGIKINQYWADIGSLQQYLQSINDALLERVSLKIDTPKANFGWKGNGVIIDPSVKIEGNIYLGENVKIGPNVVISGLVYIEKNCVIEGNSYISNSMIWAGSHIGKNVKVINSIIGNNCWVSEGTEMISNSVWAPGTKIEKSSKPNVVLM